MSPLARPVSILESLEKPLPKFDNTPSNAKPPQVDDGAVNTQIMPPPKIAVPRRQDIRWHKLGAVDLNPKSIGFSASLAGQMASLKPTDKWAAKGLIYTQAFRDKKFFIPEKEDNITHSNEADVVQSAGLYLIHPVMQAISAYPRYYHQIISQAEDYGSKTRTDIIISGVAFFWDDDEHKPYPTCFSDMVWKPTATKIDNVYLHGYDDETDTLLEAMPKISENEAALLYNLLSKILYTIHGNVEAPKRC